MQTEHISEIVRSRNIGTTFNIFSASSLTKLLAGLYLLVVTLRVRLMKEALSAASHVPTNSTPVDTT